jgi:hypothetical protein
MTTHNFRPIAHLLTNRQISWWNTFDLAYQFFQENGDSYFHREAQKTLHNWAYSTRKNWHSLTEKQKVALKAIGFQKESPDMRRAAKPRQDVEELVELQNKMKSGEATRQDRRRAYQLSNKLRGNLSRGSLSEEHL